MSDIKFRNIEAERLHRVVCLLEEYEVFMSVDDGQRQARPEDVVRHVFCGDHEASVLDVKSAFKSE